MQEGVPQDGNTKAKNKNGRSKKPKDVPAPSKYSSVSATRMQSQTQSYVNYYTPPRPTPPHFTQYSRVNGKGHGRGDWNATSRAKADAILANTSSHWYAGAAFDRSPAAHTLPHPTKLLATTGAPTMDTLKSGEVVSSARLMATSCPSSNPSSVPPTINGGSKTHMASPESKLQSDLRAKSQDLLRMLKGGQKEEGRVRDPLPSLGRGGFGLTNDDGQVKAEANGRDVEELTRQVRQLLNLPPPSGR